MNNLKVSQKESIGVIGDILTSYFLISLFLFIGLSLHIPIDKFTEIKPILNENSLIIISSVVCAIFLIFITRKTTQQWKDFTISFLSGFLTGFLLNGNLVLFINSGFLFIVLSYIGYLQTLNEESILIDKKENFNFKNLFFRKINPIIFSFLFYTKLGGFEANYQLLIIFFIGTFSFGSSIKENYKRILETLNTRPDFNFVYDVNLKFFIIDLTMCLLIISFFKVLFL